jgi:PAS domain S-box-containing protein/putative nucleotidyltransferase with HDIG domain
MKNQSMTKQALLAEIGVLRARLEEAQETLEAIRSGAVDAVVVGGPLGGLDSQEDNVSAVTDLSRFVDTTRALRESEDKFKYLFDHSPIGKSITAPDGDLSVNQAFCSMLGYSAEELRQRRWQDISHPDDIALTQAAVDSLLAGERDSARFTKRYLHKSGAVVWVDLSTALRKDETGKPLYFITSVIDITERRQTEQREHELMLRIERAMFGTVDAVSRTMDLRDPYTAGHERRVGEISAAIAAEIGLDANVQSGLRVAGSLHDVGKMILPAEILSKPSKLWAIEYEMIKMHAEQGYEVLKDIDFPWPVAEVARQHHERTNGSGYPRGLKGDEILLEARILAVADVVEAMSSHRPYRPGLGVEAAMLEIEQGAGTLYDATAVAACLRLFRDKGYAIPA